MRKRICNKKQTNEIAKKKSKRQTIQEKMLSAHNNQRNQYIEMSQNIYHSGCDLK